MVRRDYEKVIEVYNNRVYRRRRVTFYSMLVLVVAILITIAGVVYIKKAPIDYEAMAQSETVIEVMEREYGGSYDRKLRNVAELRYNKYYDRLMGNYKKELNGKQRPVELDKKALEVAFFVEYVSEKANRKAESLGYQDYSQSYYNKYTDIIEREGRIKEMYEGLVEAHQKEGLDSEVIKHTIGVYEGLISESYTYLTSLGLSEGE